MRIVFFTNAYEPIINGVVTTVRLFYEELIKQGHQVLIFAPAHRDWYEDDKNIYRFPALNLSKKIYFPIAIPYYQGLTSLLREFKPDVIHAHHPFVLGRVGLRQAKKLKIPIVYTFHTQYELYSHYFPLPDKVVRYLGRTLVTNYCNQMNSVTTPTKSMTKLLERYKIKSKILSLINPLDFKKFVNGNRNIIREQYQINDDFLLLYVGRLSKEKNLEMLLKAFAILLKKGDKKLNLFLVGGGPAEKELKILANNLGIERRVIFVGMVSYEEVANYYAAADLFVMPSITETFGIVTAEAQAAGLPVVAVDADGNNEVVCSGVTGLLTENHSEHFANTIDSLLNDHVKMVHMSKSAKQRAENFAVERVVLKLLAIYQEVIKSK